MINLEILEFVSKEIHQKSKTKQKSRIDYHQTISAHIELEYLCLMVEVDKTLNLCSC